MRVLARIDELAAIDAFLADLGRQQRRLLMLTGDVGIGRTTLWNEALDRAAGRGHLVLSARPTRPESALGYSGLADVLEPVAAEVLDALPRPQRRAVEFALLHAEPDPDEVVDPRSVAVGILGGLRALALRRPVLLAVDDVHWLDDATAHVLSFALRRLGAQPVGMIATASTDAGAELAPMSLDGLGPEFSASVALSPLGIGALRELLAERLDLHPEQRMLTRLHEASGGNPYFALELAAAARPLADTEHSVVLPVPGTLRRLVQHRLARLSASARRVLLLAALAADAQAGAIVQASPDPAAARLALEDAAEAGVLDLRPGRIGFRQPLVRSVVIADSTGRERREAHGRLATVLTDPADRFRHLALSVDGPDAGIADQLDGSARAAYARGAPAVAAELGELAVVKTPPTEAEALRRRTENAAEFHHEAGDAARARNLINELIAARPPSGQRAALMVRLAKYQRYSGAPIGSWVATLSAALAEVGDDVDVRVNIHLDLGLAAVNGGEIASAPGHIAVLLKLVDQATDSTLVAQVYAGIVWVDYLTGNGFRADLAQRALAGYDRHSRLPVEVRPPYTIAVAAAFAGELDTARTLLDGEYVDALRSGADTGLPTVLWLLTFVETRAGNWVRARQLAEHGQRAGAATSVTLAAPFLAGALAQLRAVQGHPGDTLVQATQAIELGATMGVPMPVHLGTEALAVLALSQSDPARTHELLNPLSERLVSGGVIVPGLARFVPDHVEALIRLADLGAAERLLTPFGDQAVRQSDGWAAAATARCRGLLAIAGGDVAGALAAADVAVDASAGLGMPLEHARALLVAGEIHRRARHKRRAHDSLTAAKAAFDGLGAVLWSARCRDELARTGLRTGRAPVVGGLTTAEQRVADLAAQGYTTKQIAATLFTGTRTVEAHLQRIYRKLSVHSRLELARRLTDLATDDGAARRPKGP
ncbi:MAG: hypothetical protein QOG01_1228 [Pseudonocardiales bacterium]|nr:hypothetical protein [Pseudonocardiales bacterium]